MEEYFALQKEFIDYVKGLKEDDFYKKVNDSWLVKDVVAHILGWEKENPEAIRNAWMVKKEPWFANKNVDDFNSKITEFYKDWEPEDIIGELEKCQEEVLKELLDIGEENLKDNWFFRWIYTPKEKTHYYYHFKQIKDSLK